MLYFYVKAYALSAGRKKVFLEMNDFIMQEYPEVLYERDLVIHAIQDTRLQMRASVFSHDIMGDNGEIHLTNRDYRQLLGLLSSVFERASNKNISPVTLLLPALQEFEGRCQPGARFLVDRIRSLVEYEFNRIKCSFRRRIRDVIRLLELSYPLGTSMTDPNGGKDHLFVPAKDLLCIESRAEGSQDQVRMYPVRNGTAVLSVSQELRTAYAVRTDLKRDDVARAGPDRQFKSFFNQPLRNTVVLQPDVHLGQSLFPGTIVIVRLSDRIAIMMKDVLSYASPQEQLCDDENGNTDAAMVEIGAPSAPCFLSSVTVSRRGESGGFDPSHPDRRYLFYDREKKRGWNSAFGSTTRYEQESP